MKMKLTITIDPRIVKKVDAKRGLIPRSTFIEDCIKRILGVQGG